MSYSSSIDLEDTYDLSREMIGTSSMMGAQQWGPRLGMRLLPGIGTAMLAYQAAPFAYGLASWGYEKYTGKSLDDTMVGKAAVTAGSYIESGVTKAQRVTLNGVSSMLGMFGWKDASEKTSDFADWYLQDKNGDPIANGKPSNIFKESEDRLVTQETLPIAKFSHHINVRDRAILNKMQNGIAPKGDVLSIDEAFSNMKPIENEISIGRAKQTQSNNLANSIFEQNPNEDIVRLASLANKKQIQRKQGQGMEVGL